MLPPLAQWTTIFLRHHAAAALQPEEVLAFLL
jgi:hypothetical protein